MRQNLPMPTQVSFKLGGSQRDWRTLRQSDNPFSAVGGPLPQITIPLEARVSDRGVSIEILRLAFDLNLSDKHDAPAEGSEATVTRQTCCPLRLAMSSPLLRPVQLLHPERILGRRLPNASAEQRASGPCPSPFLPCLSPDRLYRRGYAQSNGCEA
jgi:hypothetical protein